MTWPFRRASSASNAGRSIVASPPLLRIEGIAEHRLVFFGEQLAKECVETGDPVGMGQQEVHRNVHTQLLLNTLQAFAQPVAQGNDFISTALQQQVCRQR